VQPERPGVGDASAHPRVFAGGAAVGGLPGIADPQGQPIPIGIEVDLEGDHWLVRAGKAHVQLRRQPRQAPPAPRPQDLDVQAAAPPCRARSRSTSTSAGPAAWARVAPMRARRSGASPPEVPDDVSAASRRRPLTRLAKKRLAASAWRQAPGGKRLGYPMAGQLAHVQAGPALASGAAPVGAVLVGHPQQAGPPAGVEALAERGAAAVVGVLEQVVVGLVEDLEADQALGDGWPVGEASEAQPPRPRVVEGGQPVLSAPFQPAPPASHGGEGTQRIGEALAAPDVHVPEGGVRPLEAPHGDKLPVDVGRVRQDRGLAPGAGVDAGPPGGADHAEEGRGPAAVVGDGGHVQPCRPHAGEGAGRVASTVRQPGVVVQIGVDQPGTGEQP
jgi:hypothetical protein